MEMNKKASTGLKGFDQVIDMLRLEDNVVWQVESVDEYRKVVDPYVAQAVEDKRNLVYIRFGTYPPLVSGQEAARIYEVSPSKGFESFAMSIHNIIEKEGQGAFYVFDCLTDLLEYWYSDLMIGNFFRVTCPFLFQLDTVAYFALIRRTHTYDTIARIRETTQLLLDLYTIKGEMYIHPLKVWERYSPTMFFPHLIRGEAAVCITASAEAAELFANIRWNKSVRDYWELTLAHAEEALRGQPEQQAGLKHLLLELMIGQETKIYDLFDRYFQLEDLLQIARREIGTGRIGGKSAGMLLARKILKKDAAQYLENHWEAHDSYYLGADVFYTYIVQNDLWQLRAKQKTQAGYFEYAPQLKEQLMKGTFPKVIREQFMLVLEYFGQSPIIVRSSSLLEDNYGNAFAGKYDSIFLANQGTPKERFAAFEDAVRRVYASTMNQDALAYRANRGLIDKDEQMAILIQRVSGDHYQDKFFPHIAGMGNSLNLYVWDKTIDPESGMLRLVFGLGTRAVDRVSDDYPRIVSLDSPLKAPPVSYGDEWKFSQHRLDCISLAENTLVELPVEEVYSYDLKTDKALFFTPDYREARRLKELGYQRPVPQLLDFKKLLQAEFSVFMKQILKTLQTAYDYPVDIEFTANFTSDGQFRFNLLQCRPLQTKGFGKPAKRPGPDRRDILLASTGQFMGGNIYQAIDYVIFIKGKEYQALSGQDKYQTARLVGQLNEVLKNNSVMLAGPGRWGTTTPALGVPVHFTEVCNVTVLCEVSYQEGGMMPELSFGSHFFQDIVESGIFYSAVFEQDASVTFRPSILLEKHNQFAELVSASEHFKHVIHVAKTDGLTVYSDIMEQKLICFFTNVKKS